MSVPSSDNQISFTGSGTTGPFDFSFSIFLSSDLTVVLYNIAAGTSETLTENTDYVVTIDGDGTGSVDTVAAVESTHKIIITRVLPLTQEVEYEEGDKFPAATHEEALDRACMRDQQLQEQIDRCIKITQGSTTITPAELLEDIEQAVVDTAASEAAAAASAVEAAESAESITSLIDGSTNPTNLLRNGDFECWSAGAAAAPDGWTFAGVGGSVAREASTIKVGTYSAKVTRGGASAALYQEVCAANKGIDYWKGRKITFGAWCWASVANRACINLYSNGTGGGSDATYHTGGSTWEWLTTTYTVVSDATIVQARQWVINGDTSAYFDGAVVVEGESAFAFSPKPAEEGVWANYSAVSTIVGWSSFTAKQIYTKKIGKTVFVWFGFSGTSNATSVTFTVPYASAGGVVMSPCQTNNNASPAIGYAQISTSTVTVYRNPAADAWTGSGTNSTYGQLVYESA